jgi:hypothetical protein
MTGNGKVRAVKVIFSNQKTKRRRRRRRLCQI